MSSGSEYDSDDSRESDKFTVPKNFTAIASSKFSFSNLNGKQIWLVKIPRSIDVPDKLQVPSYADIQSTSKTSKGKKITISENIEEESISSRLSLLVPTGKSSYKKVDKKISKVLDISDTVEIPNINVAVYSKCNNIPDQPTGLKMRYKPIGAETGSGDTSMASTKIKTSKKNEYKEQKKRKHHNDADSITQQKDKEDRKRKKKKEDK
ncbi:DNA-directed RNA polymerase I, subunit RPA34.5 [Dipodascopsis uninucleata]